MYSERQRIKQAYSDGEKPLSRWSKAAMLEEIGRIARTESPCVAGLLDDIKTIPLPVMRKYLLYKTSRHMTGNVKRHTYFYSVDKASLEHLTKDRIKMMSEEKPGIIKEEKCICTFLEWQGPRRRPHAVQKTEEGTIKGMWFYRPDGTRKSIKSAGFMKVKDL